jgi:hypothetical protein
LAAVVVVAGGALAMVVLVAGRFGRRPDGAPPASLLAGSSPSPSPRSGSTVPAGGAAPPRFVRRPDQPAGIDRTATDGQALHQRLDRWLHADAQTRQRALERFVREASLDDKGAARLQQLARGASETARSLDRLGDRAPFPAAAFLDDTEAVLRWILSEKQWALFCQRVLDQQT